MHIHRFTSAPSYVPHFLLCTGLYIKYFYSHILLMPILKNLVNRPCCTALSGQNGATEQTHEAQCPPTCTFMFMLGHSVGTGLLHSASSCFSFRNASSNAEKDREVNSFTNVIVELTCTNCKAECLLQDFS